MDKRGRPVYDWESVPYLERERDFSIWAAEESRNVVISHPEDDYYNVPLTSVESIDDLISRLTRAREWLAKATGRVS